jgi:hypothetical protein
MTPQQVIRTILDAATEGNLSKAEKALEGYGQECFDAAKASYYIGEATFPTYRYRTFEDYKNRYSQSIKQQP